MTVNLGTTGMVTDGVATIGSDGSVSATGTMSGGFGGGVMTLQLEGSDSSNKITGAFAGEFTDPFSSTKTKFTGRAFSQFGGSSATGCAKYRFTGSMPPMRVDQMLPPFLGADQLANFLKSFGMQLGISLTEANYKTTFLCPNDNYSSADATSKPMIKANSDNTCPDVTDEGVECFSIKNVTQTTTYGTKIEQVFTIIANSGSPYFDTVNAFDVAALDPSIGSLAFVRAWDCAGSFTPIDFSALTLTQLAGIEKFMTKCFLLEEKAFAEDGAGGYNCHKVVMGDEINDSFTEGAPSQSKYGGEYVSTTGSCPAAQAPERLFADTINATTNELCMNAGTATCQKFTVTSNNMTGLSLTTPVSGVTITGMAYAQSGDTPATTVTITFQNQQGSCNMGYNISQPTFAKPSEYGSDPNVVPQACKDAGLTRAEDEEACHQLCQEKPGAC